MLTVLLFCFLLASSAVASRTVRSPINRPRIFPIHYHRECVDLATDCASKVELCDSNHHATLMTYECRRTCNRCETVADNGLCADKVSRQECMDKQDMCQLSSMYDTMTKLCAATCGRCCADLNDRCELMVQLGYCENQLIPFEQKKENCAKSCGWC